MIYHLVCPAKYRKRVFTPDVETDLKNICLELGVVYEVTFLEIGADSEFGNETTIQKYVKKQGQTEYKQIHKQQISLWD